MDGPVIFRVYSVCTKTDIVETTYCDIASKRVIMKIIGSSSVVDSSSTVLDLYSFTMNKVGAYDGIA